MTPEALEIRDAAVMVLRQAMMEAEPVLKHIGINRQDLEPDDQLPALIVLADRERHQPDGDLNAGEPSFITELSLVFLLKTFGDAADDADDIDQWRNPNALESDLQPSSEMIVRALLSNPKFVGLFEGVASMEETRSFPRDGETFYAQARIEMVVQYRMTFPPYVPDDYRKTVLVTKRPGADPDAPPLKTVIDLAST
ncbi:hypothetical protein [Methylobacterium dankookense]|uniref:Uncharacterized protein n=1 Tax=Methylobacterium dankookense TaxID=560405 RepID=A0A564G526_9HYPH|nr:hypothetical protein [Methylobacterium dankookense]GJD58360.1 hypothetical protein IFDJLNFL_4279 [Methylobacterium dankookense]VUF15635.1 hypothetical protein MTDSW087_05379 [Methylobacterium dankookense]